MGVSRVAKWLLSWFWITCCRLDFPSPICRKPISGMSDGNTIHWLVGSLCPEGSSMTPPAAEWKIVSLQSRSSFPAKQAAPTSRNAPTATIGRGIFIADLVWTLLAGLNAWMVSGWRGLSAALSSTVLPEKHGLWRSWVPYYPPMPLLGNKKGGWRAVGGFWRMKIAPKRGDQGWRIRWPIESTKTPSPVKEKALIESDSMSDALTRRLDAGWLCTIRRSAW